MARAFETGFFGAIGVGGAIFLVTMIILCAMLCMFFAACGGCLYIGSQAPTPPPEPVYVAPTPEEHSAIAEEAGRKAMAEEAAAKRLGLEVVEEE